MSQIGNDFLDNYMTMVEDTESPRMFHLWSAISAISSCMGRRLWLPFGNGKVHPNMYVLLVGGAGARKSTAMNIAMKLVRRHTGVRFAQDDCSGKRQGIIANMVEMGQEKDKISLAEEDLERELKGMLQLTPEVLERVTIGGVQEDTIQRHPADRHYLQVAASEFNTFIGHGNIEFLEFLGKMYDGEEYEYRLKSKDDALRMDDPLIGLIGCTTPTNISTAMPAEAIGQGFMSRIILIYGNRRYKSIARPRPFPKDAEDAVIQRLTEVYFGLHGQMEESPEAFDYTSKIYDAHLDLTDGRFTNYLSRRFTHFLKLGMILAASRNSMRIELKDYELADSLLRAAEVNMPDALGEYGMSALAAAKQKILEAIQAAREPLSHETLYAFMRSDVKMHDLIMILKELAEQGKIMQTKSPITGGTVYIPAYDNVVEKLELMDQISTAATTEVVQ